MLLWDDLFTAVALLVILEGIMPFLSPNTFRNTMRQMLEFDDQVLRIIGFSSMCVGLGILYFVRA